MTILNLSAYRFVHVPDPAALRDHIHALAQSHHLKGTVLVAEEGINIFVAGVEPAPVPGSRPCAKTLA